MKINIYILKKLLTDILVKRGLSRENAEFVANDYWESEISGKKTHGIIKFYKELQYLSDKEAEPQIVIDKNSVVLINANKEIGPIATKKAIDILIQRTKKNGVAIVGMINAQRYGALNHWASFIAKANLVGIITNSSEPAVAPYGGISPILGTNPLSIGIPTTGDPIILDMATSKSSMSQLLLAQINKELLPEKTFLNKKGGYTSNPEEVNAVEGFGGYKSYGLALILQILSGSLITAKMGSTIKSHYDVGYFFQAIDPSIFQNIKIFKSMNDKLLLELKTSKRKNKLQPILIPGERNKKTKKYSLRSKEIEISEKIYKMLLNEINI